MRTTLKGFAAMFISLVLSYAGATSALAGPCQEDCGTPAPVNVYSHTTSNDLSPVTSSALPRVYVPNSVSNSVTVIDSTTLKVIDRFKVGLEPQHVVCGLSSTVLCRGSRLLGPSPRIEARDPSI